MLAPWILHGILKESTMDYRYQDMIRNNFLELIEKTENIESVIDELVTSHTITKDKADRIMSYDEEDRASVLYNLLPKCGPHAFNNLLRAFLHTGNESAALLLKDNRLTNQSPSESASPVGSQDSENEYEEKYRVKTNPRGIVLLINVFKYDFTFQDRHGSQVDTKNLKELFESMGYVVQEELGGTKEAIENAILNWKDQQIMTSVDSGIIIIMAHGKEGIYTPGTVWIHTSDEKTVESEWIIENMSSANAPRLHGKPKLIFILTCRGEMPDYGSDTEKITAFISVHPQRINNTIHQSKDVTQFDGYAPASPSLGDVLLVYPCAPGKASSRDANLGSWFVQEMCKVFKEKARVDDVETMLKEMDRNLAKQRQEGFRNYFQVICTTSRGFKRKFFLNPRKSSFNGNS